VFQLDVAWSEVWGDVATSRSGLRWKCDSPRMGCAWV